MKLKILWPKVTRKVELEVPDSLPIPSKGSAWEFSWYSDESRGTMFHKLTAQVRNVLLKSDLDLDGTLDTEVTIILGEANNYITSV